LTVPSMASMHFIETSLKRGYMDSLLGFANLKGILSD